MWLHFAHESSVLAQRYSAHTLCRELGRAHNPLFFEKTEFCCWLFLLCLGFGSNARKKLLCVFLCMGSVMGLWFNRKWFYSEWQLLCLLRGWWRTLNPKNWVVGSRSVLHEDPRQLWGVNSSCWEEGWGKFVKMSFDFCLYYFFLPALFPHLGAVHLPTLSAGHSSTAAQLDGHHLQ